MVAPDRYPHLAQLSRRDRPASRYSPNTQLARPQTYVRPQIQPLWPRSVYRERLTLATGTAVLPSPDSASIVREPTEGIGRIRPGNGPPKGAVWLSSASRGWTKPALRPSESVRLCRATDCPANGVQRELLNTEYAPCCVNEGRRWTSGGPAPPWPAGLLASAGVALYTAWKSGLFIPLRGYHQPREILR